MADTKPEAEALLPTVGSHWLHRKSGGTYYVLAVGKIEADLIPAVVYQSTYDDKVWVRPLANFMDGRFEQTPDPRAALTPKPVERPMFPPVKTTVVATYEDLRWQLHTIAGHLRGMNRWKEAKRVQAASYAMYPKGKILPQPMIPRSHHG